VVLNIYNTVHNYNIKKSGTITGKAAILEPQNETNIWVASVDATQKPMRYLSVIRQKSLTERNETDTCPLTDSKRVHVIDQTISLLSDFFTDSLPSI